MLLQKQRICNVSKCNNQNIYFFSKNVNFKVNREKSFIPKKTNRIDFFFRVKVNSGQMCTIFNNACVSSPRDSVT